MIYALYGQIGKVVKFFEEKKLAKKSTAKYPLPGHSLYHFYVSSFSSMTRQAIYDLELDIPFKDILLDVSAYDDLVKQGGKDQVPCLRIEIKNGTQWMYESHDIIAYLKKQRDGLRQRP